MKPWANLIILFLFGFHTCFSQSIQKEYNNGHGGKIILPQGDISFADKVVSYKIGNPPPVAENANPLDALGKPDFNAATVKGFVSLGTGGELVLSFSDNALVNID